MNSAQKFRSFVLTEPIYENGDLKIKFDKSNAYSFLSAKHYGWKCPSMYNDSPEENGNCDVKQYEKGLSLEFTEDNYSERVYLSVYIPEDLQSLVILQDDYGRMGITLKLI